MKDVEERGAVPSVPSQSARQRESMDIDPHVNPGECKDFCYSHYILFSICIFVAQRVDEKKQSTASGFRPSTTIPKVTAPTTEQANYQSQDFSIKPKGPIAKNA
jgi:hypothetical protein